MYLSTGKMKDPRINVLSQKDFKERVSYVFDELGDILGRSFGPYGAPTIISQYPYTHVTKDGHTIAKSLIYANDETNMDAAILRLAMDICGRLNNSVGDGTTTAIVATNTIYQSYKSLSKESAKGLLPRDIIAGFEYVKKAAVEELKKRAVSIQSDDPAELRKNIEKVVYISSNADTTYTEMIGSLYEELHIPAITVEKSPDGITRATTTEGYQADVCINDLLYINNDNGTMVEKNLDILLFTTAITEEIYIKLIKPIWATSVTLGRKLMIIATSYDTMAMEKIIARDINAEWNKTHNSSLILTTVGNTNKYLRKRLSDLSVLLNTTPIDRTFANILCDAISNEHKNPLAFLNMNERNIPGIYILTTDGRGKVLSDGKTDKNICELDESAIRVGFVSSVEAGKKHSVFRGFYYDEERLAIHMKEAQMELKEAIQKYATLGTFNMEITQAENRYYALLQKMGTIEVGADTEMNQALIVDSVDDSVKAAASAFNNGVILGGNTTLISAIYDILNRLMEEKENQAAIFAAKIMLRGFMGVQKKVIQNAFPCENIKNLSPEEVFITRLGNTMKEIFGDDLEEVQKLYDKITEITDQKGDAYDYLVVGSIYYNKVFDVTTKMYSANIINSAETDSEVIKATSDLISILISGNQMVLTTYGRSTLQ